MFPTETTALNPRLIYAEKEQKVLSYYRAINLGLQTEHSYLLYLDEEDQIKKETKFGHRTRVQSLEYYQQDSLIAYSYERAKLNTSLTKFKDSVFHSSKVFTVSDETNIPTDLLIKGENSFYISGIAHGFHYRDGHQYKNQKAEAYVMNVDKDGNEIGRHKTEADQHCFVNDLMAYQNNVIATGTIQSDSTGMDVHILSLTDSLNPEWQYVHKKTLAQKGIKSILHSNTIYTLSSTIDPMSRQGKIMLTQIDTEGKLLKETAFTNDASYEPKDFIIVDDYIYIIASKQESRTSEMFSVLLKVDLSGGLDTSIILKVNESQFGG